jgi:uncharacterized protein (DUF1015 family)
MKEGNIMAEYWWTKDKPKVAEYYFAIYKDKEDLLDGSPEAVKVYFDGKWKVFRPKDLNTYKLEDFEWWSSKPLEYPEW